MAVAMRDRVIGDDGAVAKAGSRARSGVGIAQGYATLGRIGFEGRFDYAAIGTVPNLASRICGEAKPGQILISQRVMSAVEEIAETEPLGMLSLKGLARPIPVHDVRRLKTASLATG
jgi:class 3 adenylate cyclase